MGATELELMESTRRRLGHPTIRVELNDEQLQECIDDAKRWLAVDFGIVAFRTLQTIPGVSEYVLPDDTLEVRNLFSPASHIPPLIYDREFPFYFPFPSRAEGGVVFSYPATLYSGIVQQLQWIEQLRRTFGTEITFDYQPEVFLLRIFPSSQSNGGTFVVEYLARTVITLNLMGEAEQLLRRYILAQAKLILGRIRGKYDTLPTAGGDRGMDGKDLLEEGKTELEELKAEAAGRSFPISFVTG